MMWVMQKWEYMIVLLGSDRLSRYNERGMYEILSDGMDRREKTLNTLGEQGWEIIDVAAPKAPN